MIKEVLQKVNDIWEMEKLDVEKPIGESQIIKVFSKFNPQISRDVIDVYSNLGGMSKWGTDSVCFSFWTMEMILEENESNSELIFFADFLIHSHLYGFKFVNESISSIHIYYSEKDIEKVADSFSEFFEIYLKEPEKLNLFERESDKLKEF